MRRWPRLGGGRAEEERCPQEERRRARSGDVLEKTRALCNKGMRSDCLNERGWLFAAMMCLPVSSRKGHAVRRENQGRTTFEMCLYFLHSIHINKGILSGGNGVKAVRYASKSHCYHCVIITVT